MQKTLMGLLALVLMLATTHMSAVAGNTTVDYKPGVIKAALAKGETVLIHYKSSW